MALVRQNQVSIAADYPKEQLDIMLSPRQSTYDIQPPIEPIVVELVSHTKYRRKQKPYTRPTRLKTKATPPSGGGQKTVDFLFLFTDANPNYSKHHLVKLLTSYTCAALPVRTILSIIQPAKCLACGYQRIRVRLLLIYTHGMGHVLLPGRNSYRGVFNANCWL